MSCHRAIRHFSSLCRAQAGSALPLVGLAIFAVLSATGAAVDISRAEMVQAKLANALDAAGLAAGSNVSTVNASATAQMYFNANFPAGYNNATASSVTVTVSPDNTMLNLSVQAVVPTTFMQLFGQNSVTVSATSQITRQSKGMELVLVLDNTGSMNNPVNPANSSTPKITALKSAATELLASLYGSNNTVNNLWVGVVPFTQTVNIGTGYSSWMNTSFDGTQTWGTQTWQGCVMARSSPYDTSDDVPANSSTWFQAYAYPTTATGASSSTTCTGGDDPWQCAYSTTSHGHTTSSTVYDYSYSSTLGVNKGPNAECPVQVLPMVAEQSTVLSTINSLSAGGSTLIDVGLAWGYRMLSPNWRGLWGGEMNTNNLPLNYNTTLMNKVLILMTDGMNEFDPGNYTAYNFLSSGVLGTTHSVTQGYAYSGSAEQVLDNRTLALCNTLKANGVIIYTIGFGTNGNDNYSDATSVNGPLLQSCASNPSYYFLAPTNAQLVTAFQQIGDSLANLYISH